MKKILYLIVGIASVLSACDKEKELVENTKYEKLSDGDTKYAYLKVLNLTANSPVVNYYLEGIKFSSKLSSTGVENSGYTYNQVFPDLGYAVTTPGTHTLTAKIIPSVSADANLEVLSTSLTANAGKYYTVYTYDVYNTTTKKIPAVVMYEDTKPALDTSKIVIRIANFYTGGPSFNMTFGAATNTPLISNAAVGKVTDWATINNPGAGAAVSLKMFFTPSGTSTPIVAAGTDITLTKGRAYTLYLRGVFGNSAYPFNGTFFTSFY